jgi:hypothetical protein
MSGPVLARSHIVTTGLDPVVHAEPANERRSHMDCRVKPGNDATNFAFSSPRVRGEVDL